MTQNELIGIGYYGGLALLVAVAAIIGLGVTLQVDRAIGRWTACLMVPAMLLGTALSSLLSGRDLKYAFSNIESIAFGSEGGGSGVLRLVTAAMLALGGATVITDLFGRRRHGAAGPQTVAKPASAGQALLLAYAAFFLCNASSTRPLAPSRRSPTTSCTCRSRLRRSMSGARSRLTTLCGWPGGC